MKRLMTVFLMILCLLPLCAAAIAEPESAETTAQAITPEILAGLWELDHADSSGGIITAEQWISFFGENASMEFTPDGIWIMKAGGKTEIYFYEFVDGELFAEGGKAPLSFVNGQLIFDTGTPMAFAKSEKPGIAGTVSVDEALLGAWILEQLYLPGDIPVNPDMFRTLYGIPAPTLNVVSVGYAVMQLGDGKRALPVDEWQLEDGKLICTEKADDGSSMIWTFVREEAEGRPPAEESQTEAKEAVPAAVDGTAAETAENGGPFTYHGASWGMSREEVRALEPADPIQAPTAATGHAALVYQFSGEHGFSLVQYNFLPSGALYNITVMAPDEDGSFYARQQEAWTSLYGEPLTEAGADLHSDDDPVAVMIAALIQNSSDSDFLGWRADDETVIVMSREPASKVCYVEIRRYTDYFRFQ